MKVVLLNYTPAPEKTIAEAARLCYSDADLCTLCEQISTEKAEELVQMLDGYGHESPVEHVSFTFGIEGVSRSFLAQITRHRIASYSVQSQRYVRTENFAYVTPPAIAENRQLLTAYELAMWKAIETYNFIADRLEGKYTAELLAQGMEEKKAKARAEKMAIEDARFVLPNASETKLIVTMNVRSLRNFFRLRCCNRAQWEIRAVAQEMLRQCKEISPVLFAGAGSACLTGACTEGKMCCGHPQKKMTDSQKNGKICPEKSS